MTPTTSQLSHLQGISPLRIQFASNRRTRRSRRPLPVWRPKRRRSNRSWQHWWCRNESHHLWIWSSYWSYSVGPQNDNPVVVWSCCLWNKKRFKIGEMILIWRAYFSGELKPPTRWGWIGMSQNVMVMSKIKTCQWRGLLRAAEDDDLTGRTFLVNLLNRTLCWVSIPGGQPAFPVLLQCSILIFLGSHVGFSGIESHIWMYCLYSIFLRLPRTRWRN